MKRFDFGLQTVLDYREQLERQKQQGLAEARRRVVEQEDAAAALTDEIAAAFDEVRRSEQGALDVTRVRDARERIAMLRARLAGARLEQRKREADFAARREDYLRARNDRKVLAALKARRLARHDRGVARTEQAELDDIARVGDILRKTGS